MALLKYFSPVNVVAPTIIFLIAFPLTTLAFFTTYLALVTLLIRVSIVYFELGVALLKSWLYVDIVKAPQPNSPTKGSNTSRRQSLAAASQHDTSPKSRRGSNVSTASSTDALSIAFAAGNRRSASISSLVSTHTAGANRDFEGVGGWRDVADRDEEALWMGMNSRLELPAAPVASSPTLASSDTIRSRARHHKRSLTGGSQRYSWSPEAMRMSPVQSRQSPMQSRARTPQTAESGMLGSEGGYFTMMSPAVVKVGQSENVGGPRKAQSEARRKSLSNSSPGSAASGGTARRVGGREYAF